MVAQQNTLHNVPATQAERAQLRKRAVVMIRSITTTNQAKGIISPSIRLLKRTTAVFL